MKNVLVLGATGFLGRSLVSRLKQQYYVVAYTRRKTDIDAHETVLGDFINETHFEDILKKYDIDTVYHLISTSSPSDATELIPDEILQNVIPTVRLLEAMKNAGVKRMIFTSSGGTVYGELNSTAHKTSDMLLPVCSYGIQKLTIEKYLHLYSNYYDMDCRIARISNPYGIPPQANRIQGIIPFFLKSLYNNEPITIMGDTVRDYIHIDDTTEGLVKFGEYSGPKKILNIGFGNSHSLTQVVELMESVTGKSFVKINYLQKRICDVQNSTLDISETIEALNWKPQIDLVEGIKDVWKKIQNASK